MAIQANDPVLSQIPTDAILLDDSLDENSLESRLLVAALFGNRLLVEEILDGSMGVEGFNVNCRSPSSGFTALMIAAKKGHLEIVNLLIEANADLNLRNNDQNADYFEALSEIRSALSLAAENGHLQIVEILIESEATINFAEDSCEISALGRAAANGHLEIVEYLIDHNAVIEDDGDNPSPLILAARGGHVKVMYALIAAGANPLLITYDGESPLSAAAESKNDEAVKFLVRSFMNHPVDREELLKQITLIAEETRSLGIFNILEKDMISSLKKELLKQITLIVEETRSLEILDMLKKDTIAILVDHLIESDILGVAGKMKLSIKQIDAMESLDALKHYFYCTITSLTTKIDNAQMETPRTPDTSPRMPNTMPITPDMNENKKRKAAFFGLPDVKKPKFEFNFEDKENIMPDETDEEDCDLEFVEAEESVQKIEGELEIAAQDADIVFPTPPELQKEEPLPLALGTHCAFYQDPIKSPMSGSSSTYVSGFTQKR